MRIQFYQGIIMYLIIVALAAMVITGCGGAKENKTAQLDEALESISADSATAMQALEKEIRYRTNDSLAEAPVKVVIDSTMVLGDTITWRVTRKTITQNEELKEFDTNTLMRYFSEKSIYNNDNRRDWFQCQPDEQKTILQTVVLVDRLRVRKQPNGKYLMKARSFTEAQQLCNAEKFQTQPAAGFCSGFAVAKRIIVTAGHCAAVPTDLQNFYLIFNYRQLDLTSTVVEFEPSDVYEGVELVKQELDPNTNMDFAVIRVNRDISDDRIAPVRVSPVQLNEPLFVIGYPCGLPVKFADEARVINNSPANFFSADLDTFGGNSGSPVYDSASRVVGILVRGEDDFNYDHLRRCNFSYVCYTPGTVGCKGEDISRTSQFIPYINAPLLASAKK